MNNTSQAKPVIVCVGTTKVVGDSLGPIIGDLLADKYNIDAYVYGRSSRQVTGLNYEDYTQHIKVHHSDSLVIAVDACLGAKKDVGKIKITPNGLRAGSALNKTHKRLGDLAVLGIVAVNGGDNLDNLVKADSAVVYSLAEKIAKKIQFLVTTLRLNYTI